MAYLQFGGAWRGKNPVYGKVLVRWFRTAFVDLLAQPEWCNFINCTRTPRPLCAYANFAIPNKFRGRRRNSLMVHYLVANGADTVNL